MRWALGLTRHRIHDIRDQEEIAMRIESSRRYSVPVEQGFHSSPIWRIGRVLAGIRATGAGVDLGRSRR